MKSIDSPPAIAALDHIVLNVADVERSLRFYTEVLGLKGERVEEFTAGKVGFPSVRINEQTIIDLFPRRRERPSRRDRHDKVDGNLAHFCMVVERDDLGRVAEQLQRRGIAIHEGPVRRWGARGTATSIYFLDPDGNEIELRQYD